MMDSGFARNVLETIARMIAKTAFVFIIILLFAGLPLFISPKGGGFVFAPGAVLAKILDFIASIGNGSVFVMKIGLTEWDFRDIAPRFLWISFLYTAIPGSVGIAAGTFSGAAFRRRKSGFPDRFAEIMLATPDFFVIFLVQVVFMRMIIASGIEMALGVSSERLAVLPMIVMGIFPFFLAYRISAETSRRAEGEEYIRCARARGIPERAIAWRHLGAVIIPSLETELPVIMAFMQGTLFITEKAFSIPGMAKFFFDSAFEGKRRVLFRSVYQYDAVVLSLSCMVLSCIAVYSLMRLSLALTRKVLTRE